MEVGNKIGSWVITYLGDVSTLYLYWGYNPVTKYRQDIPVVTNYIMKRIDRVLQLEGWINKI